MKRKIIYLLVAVLCLAVFLPSCDQGGSTEAVNCTGHADADANLSCDNCGTPIHTIVNNVPTEEEEIPTVFAEIPSSSSINNLFNTSFTNENQVISTNVTLSDRWFEDGSISQTVSEIADRIYLISYTTVNNDDPYDVYLTRNVMLYNAYIAKVVYNSSVTYREDATPEKTYSINVIEASGQPCAFVVSTATYDFSYSETYYSYSFYTLDGTPIETDLDSASNTAYRLTGGQTALKIDDTLYIIEDNKVFETLNANIFVDRPMFSYINAEKNLGYVMSDANKSCVLVYDLTSWINCTWTYEIPACYDFDVFYLANGNLLIQTKNIVPSGSVNYDYTSGNTNFDLDYFVVDIATKAATEIEFGYYIRSLIVADSETDASAVKNWITANNIINKNIASDSMVLAVADDLSIIGEKGAALPSVLVENFELIADNTFLATLYYGEGTTVRKLYNANGTEIATLPNNAVIKGSYILLNNTAYDFAMNPIYSLTENQSLIAAFDTYMIIYDEGDYEAEIPAAYFYVSASNGTPVQITSSNTTYDDGGVTVIKRVSTTLDEFSNEYFVVATNTTDYTDSSNNSTVYELYNENGALVYSASNDFSRIIEGDGIFTIVMSNGEVVIAQ